MIGKQKNGSSSSYIYRMAQRHIQWSRIKGQRILDVGGGQGEFSNLLIRNGAQDVVLLDYDPPASSKRLQTKKCDLNRPWPVEDESFDWIFGLEVVEHLENPRFFFRQIKRLLRYNGHSLITTPNNLSLFSRLNFFLNGEHRYFQDSCYPAHITPLTPSRVKRICDECGLKVLDVLFSSHCVVPKVEITVRGGGCLLSGNFGVFMCKDI
jgi:2-polyprenyl-3-methyl-5-hydroxy-6-metoxy-1,4-benzoquinol methylase